MCRFNEAAADTAENVGGRIAAEDLDQRRFNEAAADTAENGSIVEAKRAALMIASMRPRPIPRKTSVQGGVMMGNSVLQ